ncbi:MAG: tRNA dihydrouridine synthase DusB [Chitinivibrionales bacterium]|nr:tRNA dihydrouridine synthase DusB [Chitinivibrionales bacterium]MBD3396427.1 tRNA dihydrouridine synthase DusB [Chitinivibrionales bacterium]
MRPTLPMPGHAANMRGVVSNDISSNIFIARASPPGCLRNYFFLVDFSHVKLILAPLAGIAEPVFRSICRRAGADAVLSEMVSAEGICRGARNTEELLAFEPHERPLGIQLFGARPTSLARAAEYVESHARPDFIDLNSGCPVPKIVRKNGGAALLKDPALFASILSAMTKKVSTPVTVKIRSGWREHEWVDVDCARIAEDCGAAAIIVHARSRSMGFRNHAYWERIALVKEAVRIPVVGNGDVVDGASARAMFEQTGCDAVMIGRAALGNPWVFSRIHSELRGDTPPRVTVDMRRETAARHLRSYRQRYGEKRAAREMKKHIAWYIKGMPGVAGIRRRVFAAQSTFHLEEIIEDYFTRIATATA